MWGEVGRSERHFFRSHTPTFTLPVNGSGCYFPGRGKSLFLWCCSSYCCSPGSPLTNARCMLLSFFLTSLNYLQRYCTKPMSPYPPDSFSITAAVNYHPFGGLQQCLLTRPQFCGSEVWCQSCWFCWGLWGRIRFRIHGAVSRV